MSTFIINFVSFSLYFKNYDTRHAKRTTYDAKIVQVFLPFIKGLQETFVLFVATI